MFVAREPERELWGTRILLRRLGLLEECGTREQQAREEVQEQYREKRQQPMPHSRVHRPESSHAESCTSTREGTWGAGLTLSL